MDDQRGAFVRDTAVMSVGTALSRITGYLRLSAQTAALGVWTGVGGRDEKPDEHGISHLLEHMAFKGTTKRSSREIV